VLQEILMERRIVQFRCFSFISTPLFSLATSLTYSTRWCTFYGTSKIPLRCKKFWVEKVLNTHLSDYELLAAIEARSRAISAIELKSNGPHQTSEICSWIHLEIKVVYEIGQLGFIMHFQFFSFSHWYLYMCFYIHNLETVITSGLKGIHNFSS
jgi:hypothetical protein